MLCCWDPVPEKPDCYKNQWANLFVWNRGSNNTCEGEGEGWNNESEGEAGDKRIAPMIVKLSNRPCLYVGSLISWKTYTS